MNRLRYLDFHQCLISDHVRTEAYKKAIFERVRPGDIVADIGTGTGILSLFAIKAGARQVYAIERTEIIDMARQVARRNGMKEKIHFIHGDSREIELPEKADVLVTELISEWGFEENIAAVLEDARRRFLREGGTVIPARLENFLVPVENREFYRELNFWGEKQYEIDFGPLRSYTFNRQHSTRLLREQMLAGPKKAFSLDFHKDSLDSLDREFRFTVERPADLHGFSGWFRSRLAEETELATSPPQELSSWRNPFFPLHTPLRVAPGDQIQVKISGIPRKSAILWEWSGEVRRTGEHGIRVERFHQGPLVNLVHYRRDRNRRRSPVSENEASSCENIAG